MNRKNYWFIIFLFLLGFSIALRVFELALGILAVIPLFILIQFALLDNSLEARSISITYILGSIISWVIGFLGCVYILSPTGYKIGDHTLTTMILINLVTWASLLGSLFAIPLKKAKCKFSLSASLPREIIDTSIQVTGTIFVVFLVANYASGGLSVREEIGNRLPPGSPLYFLTGLSVLQYLVFFLAGTRLSSPLFSNKNINYLGILLLGIFIVSLTGGREASLRMIVYFLVGTLYSQVKLKQIKVLILCSIPIILSLIFIIGYARSSESFKTGDFATRIQLIYQVATGQAEKSKTDYDSPFYTILTRIAEPTGQIVIDQVVEREQYIGFKNFERVKFIFLPKFLIGGEKLSPDDGPERLRDNYGINITEFTSAPITFMADSFERGGYIAVFMGSLILSFWLSCVGRIITNNVNDYLFKRVLIISYAYQGLRLYVPSILGVTSKVSYEFVRDGILIFLLMLAIKIINKNCCHKSHTN